MVSEAMAEGTVFFWKKFDEKNCDSIGSDGIEMLFQTRDERLVGISLGSNDAKAPLESIPLNQIINAPLLGGQQTECKIVLSDGLFLMNAERFCQFDGIRIAKSDVFTT